MLPVNAEYPQALGVPFSAILIFLVKHSLFLIPNNALF